MTFVSLNTEVEGINFIYNFDYKSYNMIALIISLVISVFVLSKKYFLGLLVGAAILITHVFQ